MEDHPKSKLPLIAELEELRRRVSELEAGKREWEQIEIDLLHNRKLLAAAEKLSHTGAWKWDLTTNQWSFSEEWLAIHGCTSRTLTPEQLLSIAHPDDRDAVRKAFEDVKNGVRPYEIEHRVIRQDTGEVRSVTVCGQGVQDTAGKVVSVYGFAQDITDRKRAESDRLYQQQRGQQYLNIAGVIIVVLDNHGTIQLLNRKGCDVLGYDEGELLGKNWFDICVPRRIRGNVKSAFEQYVAGHLETTQYYDNPVLTKSGDERIVSWHNALLRDETGAIIGTLSSGLDITERNQANDLLRQSEDRFRGLVETTSDWIWEVDKDGVYTYSSPKIKDLLGYEPGEVLGRTPLDFMPPEEVERIRPIFADITRSRKPFYRLENANVHKNGFFVTLETSGVPILDPAGNLVGYRGIDRDITDRKQAEEALKTAHLELERRVEERTAELAKANENLAIFRNFAEASSQGIGLADLECNIVYANPALFRLLGESNAETVLGQSFFRYVPEESRERLKLEMIPALRQAGCWNAELPLLVRGGAIIPTVLRAFLLRDSEGRPFGQAVVATDITERKRAEESLRQSELRRTLALDAAEAGTWEWDLATGKNTWSDELWNLYGLEPHSCEPSYESWRQTVHPEDRERTDRKLKEVVGQEAELSIEWRVNTASDETRWLMSRGRPLRDQTGRVVRYLGVVMDITASKQKESELRQWADAFEHCAHGIAMGLPDTNRVLVCNAALARMLGKPAKEVSGSKILSLYAPEDHAIIRAQIAEADRSGNVRYEAHMVRQDGSTFPVQMDLVSVADANGKVLYRVATAQDITERKRAEQVIAQRLELQDQMAKIAASVPGLVCSFRLRRDGSMSMPFATSAIEELYGLHPEDVCNDFSPIMARIHTEDRANLQAGITESARAMSPWHGIFRLRHPAKGERWIEGYSVPRLEEDGSILWHGFVQDITDRKRAEDELAWHRNHLEELVKQRTRELEVARAAALTTMHEANAQRAKAEDAVRQLHETNAKLKKATEAAQAASRAKSTFLANMSHEIRTPMTAILGFSQLIERRSDLPVDVKNANEIINRSGTSLLTLINDILDLSKIEAGQTKLSEADVNFFAMLKDIESLFGLRAVEKGLDLDFDLDPAIPHMLSVDGQKVRQVITNLLNNAIKFTDRGRIVVRATLEQPTTNDGKQHVRIEVKDTGRGIAADDLEEVFEAFVQTTDGVSGGGTGLGLTISRAFARMLGGELTVSSRRGKGATFTFTFQAKTSDMAVAAAAAAEQRVVGLAPTSARPKILVVDDVAENRELLCALLSVTGFEAAEAASGAEAIDRCRENMPGLLLMDRRMPQMNGLEAIRRIKTIPGGQAVPMIVVSAGAFEEERQEALAAGAVSFLSKPYHESQIFQEIQRVVPGIVYLYESQEKISSDGFDAAEDGGLQPLPETLLVSLRKKVATGDYAAFEKIVEDAVRPLNEKLANRLTELANSFDYEGIMAAIDPNRHVFNS